MDRVATISMNKKSRWARLKRHLGENVRTDFFLESELIFLAFATGIIDAASFADDRIFISNQTGNTVLIAICALTPYEPQFLDLRDIGLSLSFFIVGGLIAGRLGGHLGFRKRAWLIGSSAIQTLCVTIATIIRSQIHHHEAMRSPAGYAIIPLLALAFGGQVALARTVDVPEITTAMVTSAYIDVLVDPKLFVLKNRGRNRRLFLLFGLILGSVIGAWTCRTSAWVAYSLSALSKAIIMLAFCFNKGENEQQANKAEPEEGREMMSV